jgi:hypothetical protein
MERSSGRSISLASSWGQVSQSAATLGTATGASRIGKRTFDAVADEDEDAEEAEDDKLDGDMDTHIVLQMAAGRMNLKTTSTTPSRPTARIDPTLARGSREPAATPNANVDMNAIQALMLAWVGKQIEKSERQNAEDLYGDSQTSDGLCCIKALSRARAVKGSQQRAPLRVVLGYKEHWCHELGAEDDRPRTWKDVAKICGMARFKSVYRSFFLLGQIERTLPKQRWKHTAARTYKEWNAYV